MKIPSDEFWLKIGVCHSIVMQLEEIRKQYIIDTEGLIEGPLTPYYSKLELVDRLLSQIAAEAYNVVEDER